MSSSFDARSETPGARVLFVGNSLTYRGGGLDVHFGKLMPRFSCERIVKGGATLAQLLNRSADFLREGAIDILVLQDDIPETTVEAFLDSAGKYSVLARDAGARPFLLMTWPYARLGETSIDDITAAHKLASDQTGMPVIPAGLSWEACLQERPDLDIFAEDREHPDITGSYLAACCVAEGLKEPGEKLGTYHPGELSEENAEYLRNLAERYTASEAGD